TIDGSDHAITVSGDSGGDGSRNVRVFSIESSGVVMLTHLSIVSGTAPDGGGVYVSAFGRLTVQDSLFANNAAGSGGGIHNLGAVLVENSTFTGNSATDGGGVYVSESGQLTVQRSSFANNAASTGGGGIHTLGAVLVENSTFTGNSATDGGGIYVNEFGRLTVQHSFFANNAASTGGGGIHNLGTVVVENSTFTGNSAGNYGGGLDDRNTLTVQNCTLSGNVGGGIYSNGSPLGLYNTLIANNSGGDCRLGGGGSVAANDHNLIKDVGANACGLSNGAGGSLIGVDPLLGVLGDYGGPIQTFALLPGSPAIDAGNDATCLPADQRGIARPQVAACDIGAFESRGFALTVAGGSGQDTVVNTLFQSPLALTVSSSFSEPVDGGRATFTGPASGAGLDPSVYTATLDSGGAAAQAVWANGVVGGYTVLADTRGRAGGAAAFSLTNTLLKIAVLGNGLVIADRDSSPSPDDGTDFGKIMLGEPVTHTFTISNRDTVNLTVSSLGLSGVGAGAFVLSGLATPVTLPPNDAATFQVRFNSSAIGVYPATLTITNTASFDGRYDFAVRGATRQIVVANANDSGAGSLRQAIADAAGGDVITFADD
ncbi:MAG: choice-of-anchor D domain-containing protein, partial [Deltaproteobacteria bacterium]|nr:choice-of-anchor D domain-containing protein [Candidatus Anaeroferrophillacea bacterium]